MVRPLTPNGRDAHSVGHLHPIRRGCPGRSRAAWRLVSAAALATLLGGPAEPCDQRVVPEHDAWTSVGRANFILDSLIASGKSVPMIVVMPAGHIRGGAIGVVGHARGETGRPVAKEGPATALVRDGEGRLPAGYHEGPGGDVRDAGVRADAVQVSAPFSGASGARSRRGASREASGACGCRRRRPS